MSRSLVMLTGLCLVIIVVYYALTSADRDSYSEPAAVASSDTDSQVDDNPQAVGGGPVGRVYTYRVKTAVLTAAANAQCGYSDVGTTRSSPTQAAENLVRNMNAAIAPVPGENQARGPNINYVLDSPTKAWQVVVIADEAGKKLILKGYAADLKRPVIIQEVPCV